MKQRIMEDLKSAMKSGDKERLSVIRMLKGAIQMEEIAKMHELTDEEMKYLEELYMPHELVGVMAQNK